MIFYDIRGVECPGYSLYKYHNCDMTVVVKKNAQQLKSSNIWLKSFSTAGGIHVSQIFTIIFCFQKFQGASLTSIVRSDRIGKCENGVLQKSGNCTCYPGYIGDFCDHLASAAYNNHRPDGGKYGQVRFRPTYVAVAELSGDYERILKYASTFGSGGSGEDVEFSSAFIEEHAEHSPENEVSPQNMSKVPDTPIGPEQSALCMNGFINTFVTCDCHYGYTGEYCEADIILSYSGSDSSGTESSGTETNVDVDQFGMPITANDRQCLNGVPTYHENCICHFGYTGEKCDTLITMDENFAEHTRDQTGDESSGIGIPVPSNEGDESSGSETSSNEKDVGSGSRELIMEENIVIGVDDEKDSAKVWATTPMDNLQWQIIPQDMHSVPSATPLHEGLILRKIFAVVSHGINGTDTELHMAHQSDEQNSVIYRFSFVPNNIGGKSRLELTTCFTREIDIIRQYKGIPEEISELMKTSCPASHLPLGHMHIYDYEIFIAKNDMSMNGKYIITQWHGSADPTILRDQKKCIAEVSMKDIHRLCSKGLCVQGEVFNGNDQFIGINYNQGGYPPLTMSLLDGYFIITARSDERLFIEKGGCSKSGTKSVHCPDYPRQQYHVLWRLPAEKFKLDQWVKFKWEIKWSGYDSAGGNYTNPGKLISNALIRVWMNGQKIVDWKGPCGRNDGNRVPYFKIGMYNPSGSKTPIRFYTRGFHHSHLPLSEIPDVTLKNAAKNLNKSPRKKDGINQNFLKSAKKYRFATLSSTSTKQCILHAEKNYLSFLLSARFGKMVIDEYSKKIISHLIYELENQNLRIKALEDRLYSYKKPSKKSKAKRSSSAYDEL